MLNAARKARVSQVVEDLKEDASQVQHDVSRSAEELAETVTSKLKSVGVDTDAMVSAAKGKSSELQRLIAEELQTRPLRALGIAAALGVVVGLLTTR